MKTTLFMVMVSFAVLIAAIWQAVQGDWTPAIFLAILWVGLSNNSAHSVAIRQRDGQKGLFL